MRLYDDLAKWYRLLTPVSGYADEASAYATAFLSALAPDKPSTFLELGAGAGHNAFYLKSHFDRSIVLTDLSSNMLDLSRSINTEPHIEHIAADMRTLRLEESGGARRTFDCVLVHDAIVYMTTEDDLKKAITTAFVHTRPGGITVVAPDYFKETFVGGASDMGGSDSEDGKRGVRYLEWVLDPDPTDNLYVVDYALLLRDGDSVNVEHDRHIEAVYPRDTWIRLFKEVGFEVRMAQRPRDDEGNADDIFVLLRPQ